MIKEWMLFEEVRDSRFKFLGKISNVILVIMKIKPLLIQRIVQA